jgi:gliding motility-associated-like protein
LTDANTCVATSLGAPVNVIVNPAPAITLTGVTPICSGSATASLTYALATGSPDQYSLDFNAAAEAQGFTDLVNASLTASPILITIPLAAAPGIYNAAMIVRNSLTGCVSASSPVVITIIAGPTASITGTTTICNGSATVLTVNFTGTGPWSYQYSDGTTTSAIINSASSTATIPVNPSTTTSYTLVNVTDATVCPGTVSGTAVVTVSQSPLANLVVGKTLDPLCNGGVSDVTVASSQLNVNYQLRNNADDSPIGSLVAGTGGTINLSTGSLLATTTFNVLATATGCPSVELTNQVTINVTGAINAGLAVTAVASSICSGNSATIQIANSENGVLYQLRNDDDNSLVETAVPGTGGLLNLPTGPLNATTTFNVLATNGTCSIELTDLETINVSPTPDPSLTVAPTISPLCVGGSTTITVALSQPGISYQLRNDAGNVDIGSAVFGTGGTIALPTGVLNATTIFNILATGAGCPSVELTSTATVTVAGAINAGLALASGASPICEGSATTIQLANSELGIDYQLRNDATDAAIGPVVTGTGLTILFPTNNLGTTTTFNVLASNITCSIELTDTETVTVDVAPIASLGVGVSLDPLCIGGTSAVTVALSQIGVTYQIRNDVGDVPVGPAVAGTGATISLSTGALNATTVFNVLATSAGVCGAVELTALATVNVAGSIDATLAVTSSANPICAGTSTFIQVANSEVGVNYQLRNDLDDALIGAPIAGTGATINLPTGNLLVTTTINVVAGNATCSVELTDLETITISPSPALNLAVTSASPLICPGASSNIIVAGSEAGVTYQLRNNAGNVLIGVPVAGTGGNILLPTGNLAVNTVFNVLATGATCSAQLTATATVSIRPLGDPACGGGGTDCTNFSSIQPAIVTQPGCNDLDAGEVLFTIARTDGTPTTFRVIWSINGTNQTKFTSNTVSFDDLSSGLYQYTVIDEGNGKSCGPVDFFLDLKTEVQILTKQVTSNVTCFGGTDGNVILSADGSTTGEYWYRYVVDGIESGGQTFTPGAPLPGGLPADDDDFIIIKVDDNFAFTCPDTVMVSIRHTFPRIDFAVASTDVTTCNGTDGAIQVTAIGGGDSGSSALQIRLKKAVSFSTDPSGYIVLVDFEDVVAGAKTYTALAQGNYIVDVRDQLDCIQSKPIAVQAPGQVPLSSVTIIPTDATCSNEGASGSIQVIISDPGNYEVAISQDQLNVPADDQFVAYSVPSLPSITFNNLIRGAYYLYFKSSTTTCPTRTDAVAIGGVQAVGSFDVLSNCDNVNITVNNISGQQDAPFVIRVFTNEDKFFKIDSVTASSVPLSKSISFIYAPPLQHSFLVDPGTYRFVMVQTQTTGAGTCTLVSDTVVYTIRQALSLEVGAVSPSFPQPKRTGSIEITDIKGGTRFVSETDEFYYEISLYDADDDIVVEDWTEVTLNPQNNFSKIYEYLPVGVYRIRVRDAAGCEKTQDVEIGVDPQIFVPNIFTPNDDSVNDQFEVLNLPLTGQHQLIISNRWGNEVFTSSDYREGTFWNAAGTSDGIYYYRLKVAGGETIEGWVEILRGNKP